MNEVNTSKICSDILTEFGFPNESLISLVDKWKFFVGECEDGYDWDYSEYRNELKVRTLIEHILNDKRISASNSLHDLIFEVQKNDALFKCLLQKENHIEGENWWDRGVLEFAGDEYCLYMKNAHGIYVKKI